MISPIRYLLAFWRQTNYGSICSSAAFIRTLLINYNMMPFLIQTWLHGKRCHLYVHSCVQISCVAGISPRQKEDRHSTWRILTDVEPHSAEQEDHSDVIHGEEQGWFSHFFIVSGLNSSRHFSGMTVESTPASIFNQQCAIRDFFAVTLSICPSKELLATTTWKPWPQDVVHSDQLVVSQRGSHFYAVIDCELQITDS